MDYGTDPISSISPDPTLETCVAHTPTKKKKKKKKVECHPGSPYPVTVSSYGALKKGVASQCRSLKVKYM